MITIINKNLAPIVDGILSTDTLENIRSVVQTGKRVLIYLNRRGAYRAFICQDCSHVWKCPHCDTSFTEHIQPRHELICHHCMHREAIPAHCPKCAGSNLIGIGIALQAVENWMRKQFPKTTLCRLDSDQKQVQDAQIYLSTEYALRHLHEAIELAVFIHPENELNIPEFDIEERLYGNIRAFAQSTQACIIETYTPNLPLIRDCLNSNYRDFLVRILAEKKQFHYPPYTGLAYIHITHKNISQLEDIGAKLLNKIQIAAGEADIIQYDRSIRVKRAGEFTDTILLRSDELERIIETIQRDITKNPAVQLEIRGKKIL